VSGTLSNQPNRQIAQSGEILWRVTGTNAAGIFTHAYVANIMQPVFYRPVLAGEGEQGFGVGAQASQTGNCKHDFDGSQILDRSVARDAANLLSARPGKPWRNLGQRFNDSLFKAAVTFVMRCRRLQIRLPRHGLLRGKQARRTRQVAPV